MKVREYITDSLRYWEPLRLLYNGVLALITLAYVVPFAVSGVRPDFPWPAAMLSLVVLAGGANVLYCAAYPVDVFIQCSDFRESWRRFRWGLFVVGLVLASAITWFFAAAMFAVPEYPL